MITKYFITALVLMMAAYNGTAQGSDESESSYRIDQPGTITFTVGLQITGKVDKPQVVIFLPKERPISRDIELEKSFEEQILEPFSFKPGKNR